MPAWYVYILRCADGTFYTGITTDVTRRLAEHNGSGRAGARYTRARRPVSLAHVETVGSRAEAARREAAIRRLGRAGKMALCDAGRAGRGEEK
ncbi:MAG: GIY-YIG nuclease family protein [Pseudomonadota bacterium]